MLYTFAVDPRILTTWQTYSYLVHDCGVERGRMIADYPNRWRKMVWEALLGNTAHSPLDQQRIQFHLQHHISTKMVIRNSTYDHKNPDWLIQAEQEHTKKPFRAVISNQNPRSAPEVLLLQELDKDADSPWKVMPEISVVRRPHELAAVVRPLFEISAKLVKFVDPNFGPEMGRYRRTLKSFLQILRSANPNLIAVEYHLRKRATAEFFVEKLQREIAPLVPRGMRIRFLRWKQRPGGDALHARYVLTERGGLDYDVGLDAGKDRETTPISLLSSERHKQVWLQYETDPLDKTGNSISTCFELVDEFSVTGS